MLFFSLVCQANNTLPCLTPQKSALRCPTITSGCEARQKSTGRDPQNNTKFRQLRPRKYDECCPHPNSREGAQSQRFPWLMLSQYLQSCRGKPWSATPAMCVFLVKLQAHSLYIGTAANPTGFQHVLFFLRQYPHGDISAVSEPCARQKLPVCRVGSSSVQD